MTKEQWNSSWKIQPFGKFKSWVVIDTGKPALAGDCLFSFSPKEALSVVELHNDMIDMLNLLTVKSANIDPMAMAKDVVDTILQNHRNQGQSTDPSDTWN